MPQLNTTATGGQKKLSRKRKPISLEDIGFFDLSKRSSEESLMGLSMLRKLENTNTRTFESTDYFDSMAQFPVVEVGLNYLKFLPGYVATGGRKAQKLENGERTQTEAQAIAANENKKHLNKGQANGALISQAVKRKIKKMGHNWINSLMVAESFVKYKKSKNLMYKTIPRGSESVFITLTLPGKQRHTDKEIKAKCLDRFLAALRMKFNGDIHYMWVAELQLRGVVHFHILLDRYIHFSWVDKIWGNAISELGYIPETNMNNTQKIKAVEMPGYLSKYFTSDDLESMQQVNCKDVLFEREYAQIERIHGNNQEDKKTYIVPKIDGRKWGASNELIQHLEEGLLNYCRIYLSDYHEFRRWLLKRIERKGSMKDVLYYSPDKCLILRQDMTYLPQFIKEIWWGHYLEIWQRMNPKTEKNVSKYTYGKHKTGDWSNLLASGRFGALYSYPLNVPEQPGPPISTNEGVFDLFQRPNWN